MKKRRGNIFRTVLSLIILVIIAGGAALYYVPAIQDVVIARVIDHSLTVRHDELINDDALRVAICGSGSPLADPDRRPACNLVFAAGKIFVVDAGAGSFARVARWRAPLERMEAVFLTHFHSDHIGDLPEARLQSWVSQRPAPLQVYGGPGIERVVSGFTEAYALDDFYRITHHGADFLKPENGPLQPREIANPDGTPLTGAQSKVVLEENGLTVTAFAVDHTPVIPAYGYRFDYRGRSVVFSGDTRTSEGLTLHAKGADVLLHEAMDKNIVGLMGAAAMRAQIPVAQKIMHDIPDYHASPRDAAETAKEAGVAQLVLTHLIPALPGWLGNRIFLRGTDVGGVETRIAYDGMLIELPAGSKAVTYSSLGR
ncbi:MAG: MBL fold metallo-hydrolase [Alphaproteobacteria bacterium]|nr:MBL fold metallo-hydrolase [Alphaproteobacteria bacterium]